MDRSLSSPQTPKHHGRYHHVPCIARTEERLVPLPLPPSAVVQVTSPQLVLPYQTLLSSHISSLLIYSQCLSATSIRRTINSNIVFSQAFNGGFIPGAQISTRILQSLSLPHLPESFPLLLDISPFLFFALPSRNRHDSGNKRRYTARYVAIPQLRGRTTHPSTMSTSAGDTASHHHLVRRLPTTYQRKVQGSTT